MNEGSKKVERSMINEDWQNNPYGSQDIHGFRGDYITRGKGGGGRGKYILEIESLHATEAGISSGLIYHLTHIQTLPRKLE